MIKSFVLLILIILLRNYDFICGIEMLYQKNSRQ
jgi:hypothetical protein